VEGKYFDVVDWVDVLHAVEHNLANFFQSLVSSHRRDRVSLHEDITLRQQFDSLCLISSVSGCQEGERGTDLESGSSRT
jgi:hypothetical protein